MFLRSALIFICCTVMLPFSNVFGQESASMEYIRHYKDIAISEMHRTGVPASIKLSQALLESRWGQSELAVYANNHFGIKCGGNWSGEVFYRFDDDVDKEGNPIKSCFRKFNNTSESFVAHSDFLLNNKRYAFLFAYDVWDYKSWAKGLRKAGYATDKHYPIKLIELIERYELYQYDRMDPGQIASAEPAEVNRNAEHSTDIAVGSSSQYSSKTSKRSRNRNSNSSVKRNVRRNKHFHIVVPGETIANIAKMYRIKESTIHLRNRIPKDAEPLPGELLYIKGTLRLNHQAKYTRNKDTVIAAVDSDFIF